MPNWCMNKLTVSGNAAELKRFVESSMGFPAHYPPQEWEKLIRQMDLPEDTPYFCFNALIPTPPEVWATGYSAHNKQPENALLYALTGRTVPGMDGYHWNIANWGTKWDIYHDKITVGDLGWMEGCASIETEFDTAWSPPKCWLAKASELFPQLSFKLHFEEPGNYFAGDIFGEAGECSIDDYDGERLEQTFAYLRDEADE